MGSYISKEDFEDFEKGLCKRKSTTTNYIVLFLMIKSCINISEPYLSGIV